MTSNVSRRAVAAVAVLFSAAALVLMMPGPAPAQQAAVTINVGTLATSGSLWHDVLMDMGTRWRKAANIRFVTKTEGLGDEENMIRLMRLGQLQGAAVSTLGLENIAKECAALSIPLLFKTNEELDYVLEKIKPRLSKAIEAQGYVVLNWGDVGWVRIFTTKPVHTLAELKKMPIFTSDGETAGLYTEAGFTPRQMGVNDVLQQLATGGVQAVPAPPLFAAVNQWFGVAKYMIDIKYAPLVGATIISRKTWEKFDPKTREVLLQEAQAAGDRLKADIRNMDANTVAEMKKKGLVVVPLSPEAEKEWQQTAQTFYSRVRGRIVQAADFDEVKGLVEEYRAKAGAQGKK